MGRPAIARAMTGTLYQIDLHPVLRRLESITLFRLSDEEQAAVQSLPVQVAEFDAGDDIVHESERPVRSFAVLRGFACTYKSTGKGGRQVLAYHVPGDVPDFQSLHLRRLDASIAAATPCRVGFVQHEAVRAVLREQPRLVDLFWRTTLIEAALVREWMLNNGRREAYPRFAHLLCEISTRLRMVGLAPDHAFEFPVTQYKLADALSITPVHLNRVLQDLRAKGLITLNNRHVTIHDWTRLQEVAEFDPSYLHLSTHDAA